MTERILGDQELRSKMQAIVHSTVIQTLGREHPKYGLTKEAVDSLYQLVVESQIAELKHVFHVSHDNLGTTINEGDDGYTWVHHRIDELQSQLSSIGESK